MKTTLKIALIVLASALTAAAQTNVTPTQAASVFAPLFKATNWIVAPYATYLVSPNTPTSTRWGGGVLAIYDVNQYIGTGVGVDWLGQFSLVTGNVELKLPIRPFPTGSLSNLVVTPFAIAGLGTPIAGAGNQNGGLATVAGAGAAVKVATLFGGSVNVGAAYISWQDTGPYSGKSIRPFAAWQKSF